MSIKPPPYTLEQIAFTKQLLHSLENAERYNARGEIILNAIKAYEQYRSDEIEYYKKLVFEKLQTQPGPIMFLHLNDS